jgi:FtsH-binding integral membrane protein
MSSKALKTAAIVLFGLTAAMNLLGGIGTTCAAFIKRFSIVLGVYEYQWLYQVFMITTLILGIVGVWATVKLAKGGDKVYRNALILLFVGTLLGGVHYFASMQIRGKAAPANVKFFLNLVTLIVFLVLSIPGLKEKVDFSKGGGTLEKGGGGMAAILAGLLTLSAFYWAAPSHTYQGVNWVELLDISMFTLGFGFLALGIGLVTSVAWEKFQHFKEKIGVDVS